MRPAPIIARWRASRGASHDAASADVAAVRRAVISSPSIQASGTPVRRVVEDIGRVQPGSPRAALPGAMLTTLTP